MQKILFLFGVLLLAKLTGYAPDMHINFGTGFSPDEILGEEPPIYAPPEDQIPPPTYNGEAE